MIRYLPRSASPSDRDGRECVPAGVDSRRSAASAASLSFDSDLAQPADARAVVHADAGRAAPPDRNSRGRSRCSTFPTAAARRRAAGDVSLLPVVRAARAGPRQRRHYYRLGAGPSGEREKAKAKSRRGQPATGRQARRRQTPRTPPPPNGTVIPIDGACAAHRRRARDPRTVAGAPPGARQARPRARHPRRPYRRRREARRCQARRAQGGRAQIKASDARKRTRPKPPASRA